MYGKNENHIESQVKSVRVISTHKCMEFGINKWSTLMMKRRKIIQIEGIELPQLPDIRYNDYFIDHWTVKATMSRDNRNTWHKAIRDERDQGRRERISL